MTQALAIVLAAGKGTRMKSDLPKVLHGLAGAPMLSHVLRAAASAGIPRAALVVGPGMDAVGEAGSAVTPDAQVFVQPEQRGTADAVKAAAPAYSAAPGPLLVLYGDTPLLRAETLKAVLGEIEAGADLVVIGFEATDPTGYGRLLFDDKGRLAGIREEKDATAAERALTLCNSGIMAFRSNAALSDLLSRIGNDNAKGEYYLTDAVALAHGDGLQTRVVLSNAEEVLGVNSRSELAVAEGLMQRRLRAAVMERGATLVAPETVFLSYDTVIGRDVVIEPNVIMATGVTIEDGATIRGFCHFEKAHIGAGATVGPFARFRPGADLAAGAHAGNFVEIKNSHIAEGAKVNHLTYIGDSTVGPKTNIGAGTITCNYDGFAKHRTEIGAGAFIGSNSSLVAPVKIGDGAYIGSGSVISKDVPADALALTRAKQEEHEGWAAKVRERRSRGKSK
ncbi:bifunctional UDP-N-acetylglucosamine diphosphorylase/glucosamine-1-phosphate N-acetyltransferase GlmU [Methyloceanibacter sp.]|uniref:bifunctional UDP-N-acetylglucosamine diphosphorylase/glucosamine-1-phosphate N-acetyltransferase GlmU n=1 Tax=Methyloceanibacter sp. TaxID=1965321 RepID=UPI002C01D1B9|nr:bifunctional UDP-N-acetylglucosamine diphosphorylase/glucosamine-1-phosphate N-acetyltransferase GlmU [Methyloceanibacter sp.]HML93435.1 bifunctional UDP-N-acetylglucosamine diphosphorylase/glucosamine-1-phosphate N-acetyltransferase GlmU [Methyloceanibacter sp.]